MPILACARPDNRYSPAPSAVGKHVFDVRSQVPAQLRIADILQLDGHSHCDHSIARSTARRWCKPVQAKCEGLRRAPCAWLFTIGVENRRRRRSKRTTKTRGSEENRRCGTICPEMKRLRHWLCSSRQLLRESVQRGYMHRRSP